MKNNIKVNALAHILETQMKFVSEAKIKVATLLSLNQIEFEEKDKKKFDNAINSLNKMLVSVYAGIKFKLAYTQYSDKTPLYSGGFPSLKEGYHFGTQIVLCQGILSNVLNEVEKTEGIIQYLNPKTNEQIKFKKAYKDARIEAIKSLKSAFNAFKGVGSDEELVEESTEE